MGDLCLHEVGGGGGGSGGSGATSRPTRVCTRVVVVPTRVCTREEAEEVVVVVVGAMSRPTRVRAREVVVVPTRVCTREEVVVMAVVPRHTRLAFARGRWWYLLPSGGCGIWCAARSFRRDGGGRPVSCRPLLSSPPALSGATSIPTRV
jgi:hypothetical protein